MCQDILGVARAIKKIASSGLHPPRLVRLPINSTILGTVTGTVTLELNP